LGLKLDKSFHGYLKPASAGIGGALASLASATLYFGGWWAPGLLILRLLIKAARITMVSVCQTAMRQKI
jgi:hypothetical protein